MSVHLLPNLAGALIIQLTYALSLGMLIESALSFLGLRHAAALSVLGSLLHSAPPTSPSPWLAFAPGVTLLFTILSINLLGDGLRDALEPLPGRPLR